MLNKSVLHQALLFASLTMISAPALSAEQTWRRCNTHTHTNSFPGSDANAPPEQAIAWYKAHGYHCVFITDHEHLTPVETFNTASDFLVLRGQEVTQQIVDADPLLPNGVRHTHVNGLDIAKLVLPVGHPDKAKGVTAAETYARNFAGIRAAGGLPHVNHPNLQWSVSFGDLAALKGPYLLEVWNSFPTSNNLGGSNGAGHTAPSTEVLWDRLLTAGHLAFAVASDDVHDYFGFDDAANPTPGKGWVMIDSAELTRPAIMAALAAGRFYASTGVILETYAADAKIIRLSYAPSREWVKTSKGNARFTTRFIGAGGKILAQVTGPTAEYKVRGNEGYIRASIHDSDGRRAWTQPVFLDGRK